MKNNYFKMLFAVAMLSLGFGANAQCDFTPTITGNYLLCDEADDVTLSTQEYDAYQWYRREWYWDPSVPNPNPWNAVAGATNQTIELNGADDFLFEFKVAATVDECTIDSPLVLIDGYAYGLPYMISTFEPGTFLQVDDLAYNICNGASVKFENGYPIVYGLHTWYKCIPSALPPVPEDECILAEVTGDSYTATVNGTYGFYACTEYCPSLCEFLGTNGFITLNFGDFDFCALGTNNPENALNINIYPNPTAQFINIVEIANVETGDLIIADMSGKVVKSMSNVSLKSAINVSDLSVGTYAITLKAGDKIYRNKFIRK